MNIKNNYMKSNYESLTELLESTKFSYQPTDDEKQYDFKQFFKTIHDSHKNDELRMERVMAFVRGEIK